MHIGRHTCPQPPSPEETPVTGAHNIHLYIDHRIILKCTFIHPYTSHTQKHIPVHTKGTHINPSEHNTCTHAQTHAYRIHPLSGAALSGTNRYTQTCTHTHTHDHTSTIWSLVPQRYLRTDTPLARNPGYTAKSSSACDPGEAASKCSEPPLVSRPATPSPLLSTLSPHQAAPDSTGSGFGTCTTTPGAGEGEHAAARGAERASAPRVPGPCGLPPISHPRRPRSAQVVGAQNVGFPGAGGRNGVVPGPGLRGALRGPAQ